MCRSKRVFRRRLVHLFRLLARIRTHARIDCRECRRHLKFPSMPYIYVCMYGGMCVYI